METWDGIHQNTMFIVENDSDTLFICETWLGSDLDDVLISQLLPPMYKILHQLRMNRRGGGVAIMFRESGKV